MVLLYHKNAGFPSISADVLGAICELPLAVPNSVLPEASGATVPISVLLLHRSWAALDILFHTVCTKGRICLLHSRLP